MNFGKSALALVVLSPLAPSPGWSQSFSRVPLADPGLECGRYDGQGWLTLFDGTAAGAEKYWWVTGSSNDPGRGWWVAEDPVLAAAGKLRPGQKILWSDQNPPSSGGVLYTHRRYRDVEVLISVKPGWGNDGGLFLRASGRGPAWQVMMDYIAGKTVGGIWPEGLSASSQDFYRLDSETKVTTLPLAKWDAADWPNIWDPQGFNLIYAKVTGSNAAGPRIQAWIHDSDHVVTDYAATFQSALSDSGHIGLQIHAGDGSWQGGANKYEWIKVRELNPNTGAPLCAPVSVRPQKSRDPEWTWMGKGGDGLRVTGRIPGAYRISIADVGGRIRASATGNGSEIRHEFAGLPKGVYVITLVRPQGSRSYKAVCF
jgi:hypothetical protein